MKLNKHMGVLIALIILISMLLICHLVNYFFPQNKFDKFNKFDNIPTQYNIISYNKQPNNLCHPNVTKCNNITQLEEHPLYNNENKCSRPTHYQLSHNDIMLLYKYAYENAGNEVLLRTLKTMNKT